MQNPAKLYIVRHGQTDWNITHKIQGQIDIPLNTIGESQAKEAADLLKEIHFDAVFSSDLLRAHRTAEIITLERQIAIQTTHLLRERNFGQLEGKEIVELREMEKELEDLTDNQRFSHKKYPDLESDEELIGRFLTFLREVAVAYEGKNVLVVTHGGLMRAILAHTGYVTYQEVNVLWINNTGYFVLESDGVEFEITKTYGVNKEKMSGE